MRAAMLSCGPLGPTRRATSKGVTTIVNELTVFMVVRAASHQAAAELVKDHPHITHFPCDAAEVMPVLGRGGAIGVISVRWWPPCGLVVWTQDPACHQEMRL